MLGYARLKLQRTGTAMLTLLSRTAHTDTDRETAFWLRRRVGPRVAQAQLFKRAWEAKVERERERSFDLSLQIEASAHPRLRESVEGIPEKSRSSCSLMSAAPEAPN